jgi:hypothetical protein
LHTVITILRHQEGRGNQTPDHEFIPSPIIPLTQLERLCRERITRIDTQLLHPTQILENWIFHQKLKTNNYRYISTSMPNEQKAELTDKTKQFSKLPKVDYLELLIV